MLAESVVAPILTALKRTRAWQLLKMHERAQMIWCLRAGKRAAHIDDVFEQSAQSRGQHLSGELWLWGDELPANALIIRAPSGLWRLLRFDRDSEAPAAWIARGTA